MNDAIVGVTIVGDVPKTARPLPVSSVIAAARLALLGVARNVAMPVPKPLTPVLIGRPVALVSVPLAGIPSAGVTNVGDVARATAPVPVFAVTATPAIENAFPVPAVSKVLLVSVSVVALPISVSVAAGSDNVTVPKAPVTG